MSAARTYATRITRRSSRIARRALRSLPASEADSADRRRTNQHVQIGIGGGLAAPPSHTTVRTGHVSGGSMDEAANGRRTFELAFAAWASDASAAALRASPVVPVPRISSR